MRGEPVGRDGRRGRRRAAAGILAGARAWEEMGRDAEEADKAEALRKSNCRGEGVVRGEGTGPTRRGERRRRGHGRDDAAVWSGAARRRSPEAGEPSILVDRTASRAWPSTAKKYGVHAGARGWAGMAGKRRESGISTRLNTLTIYLY